MRIIAMTKRVIKEIVRDKRTVALMLLAPILLITLLNFVFTSTSDTKLQIGVDDTVPNEILQAFPSEVKITHFSTKEKMAESILSNKLDASISIDNGVIHVSYENEDPSNTAQVKAILGNILTTNKIQTLTKAVKQAAETTGKVPSLENYTIENQYIYGSEDSSFFDKIFPVIIGFLVFFFVFLISGVALLRERTTGTLERLLATPIKRSEIVISYLIGFGVFAVVQTLLIVFYSIYALNLEIVGSIGWVLVINILVALTALSMGVFISTFANTEFQMVQFIPIVVIPQILFSGIISLDTMANWVRIIGYFLPLSYAGNALTAVIVRGEGFNGISRELGVLLIFIVVFTILNIIGLKRYRKV
jgi:ABC-2 type transport system permease protein